MMPHSINQQTWKIQQWSQDWKRLVFIPIPKKDNAMECSNTRLHSSHTLSKTMLKILQARLQHYVNWEIPDIQAGFRKGRKPEIKLSVSTGWWKKQESSRKTSNSASLATPKPLTVWITTNRKILQEMETLDHLTCLLRNLYEGQEATVRTRHGTDWFQIGKAVHQGCVLSPCLVNHVIKYRVHHVKC